MASWRKSRHIVLHYYHTVDLKAFIVIAIFRAICPYLSIIFVIMSLSVYMSWNGLITWRHTVPSFFRMLAQSYTPNIYTPTPISLLYNPFTIVLHKRLSAYPFRAAHTPTCRIGTKRNKDFHHATPQSIGNQDYWPNPSREFRIKRKETDCSVKKRSRK